MGSKTMQACVIIPARFASTRYPGKPLTKLLGKPMIIWVAELASLAVGREHVYVATENELITSVVQEFGYTALMTSRDALTGTDRLAEAAGMINYDIYINVQGDEPLVDPEDIRRCIASKKENPNMILNGFCWLSENEDPANVNIPKVITTEAGLMVYMSRKSLPGFKEQRNAPSRYMKQVCIYGFTREDLATFSAFGRKSALEQAEDIEILRFLEVDRKIMMFECKPGSLAVDVPEDVPKVEAALRLKSYEVI
jgi:3-deoxy-manno-octulosonate cytidylyltransferase (CMP-KDO synthetase)